MTNDAKQFTTLERVEPGVLVVTVLGTVFTRAKLAELERVFETVGADETVRAVVLTGDEAVFIGELDERELVGLQPLEAKRFARRMSALTERVEDLGKPVIAAVNGMAFGVGNALALACTLRVAANVAYFGHFEIAKGFFPCAGATQRLARQVGRGRAFELLLTGEAIDAREAQRMGLVNRVCGTAELRLVAVALAKRLAERDARLVRHCLDAVRHGLEMPQGDGLAFEANLFGLCFAERTRE